jgi:hypothetical protein
MDRLWPADNGELAVQCQRALLPRHSKSMMSSRKSFFFGSSRFQAGYIACGFTGLAMCASAQFIPSQNASSMDAFGGEPDSYKFIRIPPDSGDWTRHFRIGAMVGLNISAEFSQKGAFSISGNSPAGGFYDDGYVHPDQSGDPKYTSYWGYNKASQFDAANQALTMHATTSYSMVGSTTDDAGPSPGFDMAYGDNLWYWKHARVGWELGFGLLPISIKDNHSQSANVNQTDYIYSTAGITLFPDAPYLAGASGNSVFIPSSPGSVIQQPSASGVVSGNRELDEILYTVRFGPSFYWDLTEDFGMSLGAGGAMGVVNGNYTYNEMVTSGGASARNSGEFSTTEVIYGGYVNGTLMYHVLDNADFYLGAQYMPMGNASFSSGGRQAELKLGGQVYVSIGVNWPF